MIRRLGAFIVAVALTATACSSSGENSKGSDSQLKGATAGPVVGGSNKTTLPVKIPTPAATKKPMTLCTSTWNPFDPTTPMGTKNLLAYAAFNSTPSTATATLSIDDGKVAENGGSVTLTVTVKINNPLKQELHMQFGWSTYDKAAVAGSDYTKNTGAIDVIVTGTEAQLTSITKTYAIKVLIMNDQIPEVDDMWRQITEDMSVRIGVCPSPAIKILKDTANVLISEDDTMFDALGRGGNEGDIVDGYLLSVAAGEAYADAFQEPDMTKYVASYLGDLYAKRGTPIIYSKSTTSSDDVFVFTTSKAVIVTFRGSEQSQDWLTDLMVGYVGTGYSFTGYGPELAHAGFWGAVANLYPDLLSTVRTAAASGKKVYVTGHSLGAAMASVFAFRAQKDGLNIEKVSTIGSPRAFSGNTAYDYSVMGLGPRTSRWIFDDDIVTHIPSTGALVGLCVALAVLAPYLPAGVVISGAACSTAVSNALLSISGIADDFRHVGEVRRFEGDIGGDNCVNFKLTYPRDIFGPPTIAINDYESVLVSGDDHSIARYVNAFWRSLSPSSQKSLRPAPSDPRFNCKP